MEISTERYQSTENYPDKERYNLTTHTRKTAISIPSNIAEGRGRKSDREFNRFLNIALGSAYKFETQIELAYILNYISEEINVNITNNISVWLRQIQTLQTKLKPSVADR